jgi:competence protein ComGC
LKKTFTLFELIIVVILISIVYYISISNINIKQNSVNAITLINLKQTLKNMDFKNKIEIKCIDSKDVECLIFKDDIIQEKKIYGLFKKCPTVYKYSIQQQTIDFEDVELDKLERYSICFEFILNKDGKSSQIIVDTQDNVYIFDNISQFPKTIKYINDIDLYFDKKVNEVKNAF